MFCLRLHDEVFFVCVFFFTFSLYIMMMIIIILLRLACHGTAEKRINKRNKIVYIR